MRDANKNKILNIYCGVVYAIGWINIIIGGISAILSIYDTFQPDNNLWASLGIMKLPWLSIILTGALLVGVGQYTKYIFVDGEQAGIFVKFGDKILYLLAIFVFLRAIPMIIYSAKQFLALLPIIFLNLARILALVGLAGSIRWVNSQKVKKNK